MWVVLALLVIPLWLLVVGKLWDQAAEKYTDFDAQLKYVMGCFTAITVAYWFALLLVRLTFFD